MKQIILFFLDGDKRRTTLLSKKPRRHGEGESEEVGHRNAPLSINLLIYNGMGNRDWPIQSVPKKLPAP